MSALIEQARRGADQAELYWLRQRGVSVRYENYQLQHVSQEDVSSVAVRAVVAGRLGTTYGVSPDQPQLLQQARNAAMYGGPVAFSFAPAAEYPLVRTVSAQAFDTAPESLLATCASIAERVKQIRPEIALFVAGRSEETMLSVETTQGASARNRTTSHWIGFGAPIHGAGAGVYKSVASIDPVDVSDELIAEFDTWYGWTGASSTPATGKLPVLFAPEASFLYLLPLWAGLSGEALERGTTPVADRVGDRIMSEALTILDDPLRDGDPGARPFDDEGVPCRRRALVDHGVLNGWLFDLRTAAAHGVPSTGNGIKRELFGGGTETSPNPWPVNLWVESGDVPYRDIIRDLDEGILLTGGMGFHSGNYPQGQFAVQALGFHIRKGRVIGRLDRTMVSGNIYRDFHNVRAVSRERSNTSMTMLRGGNAPYVLVDALQIAGA